jgi:hypothetical protein
MSLLKHHTNYATITELINAPLHSQWESSSGSGGGGSTTIPILYHALLP